MFKFFENLTNMFFSADEPPPEKYSMADINNAINTFGISVEQYEILKALEAHTNQNGADLMAISEANARASAAWFQTLNVYVPEHKKNAQRILLIEKCIFFLSHTISYLFREINEKTLVDINTYQRLMNYQALYITINVMLSKLDTINSCVDLLNIAASKLAMMDQKIGLDVYTNALKSMSGMALEAKLVLSAYALPHFTNEYAIAKGIYEVDPTVANKDAFYELALQYKDVIDTVLAPCQGINLPPLPNSSELTSIYLNVATALEQLKTKAIAITPQYKQQQLLMLEDKKDDVVENAAVSATDMTLEAKQTRLFSLTPSSSTSTLRRRNVNKNNKYI